MIKQYLEHHFEPNINDNFKMSQVWWADFFAHHLQHQKYGLINVVGRKALPTLLNYKLPADEHSSRASARDCSIRLIGTA